MITIYNRIIGRLQEYLKLLKSPMVHYSLGAEHPDKTFYVIGIDYDTQGLLAIIKNVLIHIEYAINKGYTPIVDMQNFTSQFKGDKSENTWELFFEQPCGYTLNDIRQAANIIKSRNLSNWVGHSIYPNITEDKYKNRRSTLNTLYKKYIRPNDSLKRYIGQQSNIIIGEKNNILGVLCRGSDYTQKRPLGHDIQPSINEVIVKIKEVLEIYKIDYIYVATEDLQYLESLKKEFGEKILSINQHRFGHLNVNYISELEIDGNELIKMNMDYYTSLSILSNCEYFIGGRTAGTIGVSLMSNTFKYFYCWNLGIYKE